MLESFKNHIETTFPFVKGKRLLVACSGGVDSVVLACLCVQAGLEITLAHCNFKLRGEESEGDEAFVHRVAKELNVEVVTRSFNTKSYAAQHRGSVQMAARKLRYHWFQELVNSKGFAYVLTAHHADDMLETFFINLSRGTGIEGLLGIPVQQGNILRPLLPFSRSAIMAYAKAEYITWREDSSNAETKYLRNKIRLNIVPQLKTLHPTFSDNFKQTQHYLRQTHSMLQSHLIQLKQQLFQECEDHFSIAIQPLLQLRPLEAYLYGLFHEYGFTEWNDVKHLLTATSGKRVYSKTHSLVKDRTHVLLTQRGTEEKQVFWVSEAGTDSKCPIQLRIAPATTVEKPSCNVIYVAKEALHFPLQLRNWQKGDYFYPFGMQGCKKLSKFFKDERMDVLSKDKQWLLCSGEAVVWVVGRRLDARFKVTASTQTILKITLLP